MSVYTEILVEWEGSQEELQETFRKDFDKYDDSCREDLNFKGVFFIYHPECDTNELGSNIARVLRHRDCTSIYDRVNKRPIKLGETL